MVVVRMREEDQVDRRQVLKPATRAFDAFQQKKPIGEIWVYQHVQIAELHQKRGVTNPCDGHFTVFELRKLRPFALALTGGQPRFPDHFVEKGAGIKMVAWR